MSAQSFDPSPSWLTRLGNVRWARGHISTLFIGAVLLVSINLLIGGGEMWALTAIGIWIMLLVVHIVIVLIARLSTELLADDDEEVVLLPIKDAVIIEPKADPPASWTTPTPVNESGAATTTPNSGETVSWSVATDVAQARRKTRESTTE